ncbi:hypothetical protein ECC02_005679 [Trypanosoma cruzi]|uniref:Dual specificity protein phosphatase n=1 Tax=Trypanosoma cruzi TaxID=5693 RepID=A0A7J6Y471_TRYCR|nr:hypothetical protein ECC02_005679 [Trypanosoma cruzi]
MGACIAPGRIHAVWGAKQRKSKLMERHYELQNGGDNGSATGLLPTLLTEKLGLVSSQSQTFLEDFMEELCQGPYASLFLAHPDLLFSNRAAVMCTGEFAPGEVVGKYSVLSSLPTGTVGRSFLVKAPPEERGRGRGGTMGKTGKNVGSENTVSYQLNSSLTSQSPENVFKVVTFVTRMKLAERVLDDHKVLTNLIHDNVLRCVDVLDDGQHENFVFVSPYIENGSCEALLGKLETKERLLSLLHDVAVGLRVLHSHRIYHHNLKLDNILIKNSGTACIADAGFGHIFASQSSEGLVFNGELACMPPEVFQTEDVSAINHFKADVWGFGLLMYRLAYGRKPLDVEGKPFGTIRDSVLHGKIEFPEADWVSDASFQDVVLWCLDRDPNNRPSIIEVLRHPLFGENVRHSISGSTISPPAAANSHYGGKVGSIASLSTIGARFSRSQKRGGLPISDVFVRGRNCETFLVNSARNMTKIVLKVMRRSVMKKLENLSYAGNILHDLAFCRVARHPNILHLMEIVENKDGCFATQPYAEGEFLSMNFPPLTNSEDPCFTLKGMLVDVLKGLHFLHTNGVSHLCLTPSNIFYQRGVGFVLADFGPLFLTRDEALTNDDTGNFWYSFPPWVIEDLKKPLHKTKHAVDTFCVGLLAASVIPVVYKQVWQSFYSGNEGGTIAQNVIKKVKEFLDLLTQPVFGFISQAITTKTSAKELLSHPYLADAFDDSQLLGVKPLQLSSASIKGAVSLDFSFREERRLMDVVGQDPIIDTEFLGNSNFLDSIVHEESRASVVDLKDLDSSVLLHFKDKIVCGLCHVDLSIVVFRCSVCPSYIRCGKCALNDDHEKGHEMKPYLIHTIEHKGDGNQEAMLLPPSSIHNAHVLEEVEMQANLPAGSIVDITNSLSSPKGMSLSHFKVQCRKNKSKKKLPKACEIDDLSWEEEINKCRENGSPELLLYRFDLTSVPREVFDPPLLHVVSLDLSYNKLTSIPHELSFLHKLRSLVIASNELSELPDSLGNLSQLERLDVSHNQLQQLPQSFMYLYNLATLSMDYNNFAGIPESVLEIVTTAPSMAMLSVIYLAENPRITEFPEQEVLEKFPKLKLALDNEPNVYRTYISEKLEEKLPNVSIMWNKIYPDRIVEHVYCGSLRSAQSQPVYDKLSIKSLLTVGRELVPTPPIGGEHLTLSIDDIEGADIRLTFQESVDFIEKSVKKGRGCLVHCFAGMSRSATTVIAYLMMKRGMRLDEAYLKTKEGRPAIYPNQGFFNQLLQLDAELFPQQRPLNMAAMERDDVSKP